MLALASLPKRQRLQENLEYEEQTAQALAAERRAMSSALARSRSASLRPHAMRSGGGHVLWLPRERLRGLGTFDEPRINCFYNSLALAARGSLCTSYLEHGCFVCCNLLDCRCNDVVLSPPAPPCCPSPQLCAADNPRLQHPSNLSRQDEWLGLVSGCEHRSRFRVVWHGGGLRRPCAVAWDAAPLAGV